MARRLGPKHYQKLRSPDLAATYYFHTYTSFHPSKSLPFFKPLLLVRFDICIQPVLVCCYR